MSDWLRDVLILMFMAALGSIGTLIVLKSKTPAPVVVTKNSLPPPEARRADLPRPSPKAKDESDVPEELPLLSDVSADSDLSLNALWRSWCELPEAQYPDSAFCAAGWGNPIALMVLRMRFVVPDKPEGHILKTIQKNPHVLGNRLLNALFNDFTHGLESQQFEWRKLSNVIKFVVKAPSFESTLNTELFKEYGFSTAKNLDASANQSAARFNSDKATAAMGALNFPQTSIYSGGGWISSKDFKDLDALFALKCKPNGGAPAAWSGTLFCEMGAGNVVANYLARISFELPSEPKEHAIKQLFELIIHAVKPLEKDTSYFSWTKFLLIQKALNRQLFAVIQKIEKKEKLTWEDLRDAMVVVGGDWTEAVLWYIVNPNVHDQGLEFAM
jgi:hypothetical protein